LSSPENIGYYEAHGTGTLLGDPIEIKAATDVFREYTSSSQYCAVGSVKSNLGHSLSASGLTGFVKVLQMLSHKKLIPTINCDNPHDRFRFKDSPFYPNTGLKDWESNGNARLAAISSFGFGGTNGHLIVEEFIPTMEWIKNRVPKPLTIFSRRRFIPKVMSTEQKVKIVLEDLNEKVITAEEAKRRIYAYIKD
jgi:acyl transferase domain-containing protein